MYSLKFKYTLTLTFAIYNNDKNIIRIVLLLFNLFINTNKKIYQKMYIEIIKTNKFQILGLLCNRNI